MAGVDPGRRLIFLDETGCNLNMTRRYGHAPSFEAKGSAVPGVNYAMLPATITVPAGERTVKVKIATLTGGDSATKLKLKLRGVSYRGTKTLTITP